MAQIKAARKRIERAITAATFKNATFNDDVKQRTKSYRETWIIGELMAALACIDPCPACKGKHHYYRQDCKPCGGTGIKGGLT